MDQVKLEPFKNLSSLSVNCTDDFFMTSGFCVDLGLYDLATGARLKTFRGLHQNFINILRFAHRTPHLFATASFDHSCRVWDLRERLTANRPVRLFNTDTLNVMCCFSPDDQHILCSGVDKALQQFSIAKPPSASGEGVGSHFPLPPLCSDTNYRRSFYLADGTLVATAATNESLLRIYRAQPSHALRGHIDFKRMLQERQLYRQRPEEVAAAGGVFPARSVGFTRSGSMPEGGDSGNRADDGTGPARPPAEEYVQSLRCHPTDPNQLGVLLSTDPLTESYIAMVRLES